MEYQQGYQIGYLDTVKIRTLMADFNAYVEIPKCQREDISKSHPTYRQRIIDSILKGITIGIISVKEYPYNLLGIKKKSAIIDGQQRLKTIKDFYNNEFKTSSRRFRNEPNMPISYPNIFFKDLPKDAKDRFLDYPIYFENISGQDQFDEGFLYRRLNNQLPLTWAENLYSFNEYAYEFDNIVKDHSIWNMFNKKHKNRKQIFQMAIMCLMIENAEGFKNCTQPTQARDIDIIKNIELRNIILKRFDSLIYLYDSLQFSGMVEIIPLYQSVMFLENNGLNVNLSKKGSLLDWYYNIKLELEKNNSNYYRRTYRLYDVNSQMDFWHKYSKSLFKLPGLIFKDKKRNFTNGEKIILIKNQRYRCSQCGIPIKLSDDAHHKLQHSKGGKTILENAQILCKKCHIIKNQEQLIK